MGRKKFIYQNEQILSGQNKSDISLCNNFLIISYYDC